MRHLRSMSRSLSRSLPRSLLCPLAALLTAAAIPADAALPNDWDIHSRTIPASACQVKDPAQAALVEMVQGAWRFSANNTGRVTLTCPFPISYFTADHAEYKPAGAQMTFYRVWYRDSDGATNAASVQATPYVRIWPGGAWSNIGLLGGGGGLVPPGVCQFSSNSHPDLGFAAHVQDCDYKIQINAMYSFEVTMYRNASTLTVEFHGIDFHDGGTAAG